MDVTGARWHDEVDEDMVPGWYASAYLSLLVGIDGFGATNLAYMTNGQSSNTKRSSQDIMDDGTLL